jgi:flagellar biosynthesis protein FlhB
MPETAGDKSFEATAHRRQEAREKGQVVFSQDLGSAAMLLATVLVLMMFGGAMVNFAANFMRSQLGGVDSLVLDQESFTHQSYGIAVSLAGVVLPVMGLMMLGGILTNLGQVGLLWLPEKIAPDISRLSPLAGLQRIFSLSGTMRLGFGLFKVLVVGLVAAAVLWQRWDDVLRSSGFDVGQLGKFLIDIALSTLLWVSVALVILAIFDYGLHWWKHEQDLRMTHQEIREEMKNLQGDPHIVSRRRAIQRQMVLNRISSAVPKADVIVTNPTELAVAIQYEPDEMAAPVVVAKGAGVIAQRIRRLALENNIPIVERKPLAQLLYKEVDIGHPIPADSYAAVAEVLAYVYQLQGKKLPTPRAA